MSFIDDNHAKIRPELCLLATLCVHQVIFKDGNIHQRNLFLLN